MPTVLWLPTSMALRNIGTICAAFRSGRRISNNVDDVGFFAALIGKLTAEGGADPRRVYVTGISNGGLMTHRLGCELADKITAIAPVVRTFTARWRMAVSPRSRCRC